MHVIHARNVNDAYPQGLNLITSHGRPTISRNGGVFRVDAPVTTVYARPWERVLFDSQRDANPFFHLFESLWMLDGGNDVAYPAQFLKSFAQFSDDGVTFHGAYGYRWRHWRGAYMKESLDQLSIVIGMLKKNPADRRAVIGMWDPKRDLNADSKDIPCNDLIKVCIVNGQLDMHVYCRSNDIVWGCYGANAVQFSFLQEYLASMIGFPPGSLYQISGDYHAYRESPYVWSDFYPQRTAEVPQPYGGISPPIAVLPLVSHNGDAVFDEELRTVVMSIRNETFAEFDFSESTFYNIFFREVVQPMYRAFRMYKKDGAARALTFLETTNRQSPMIDWLFAAQLWMERRLYKMHKLPEIPLSARMPVFHSTEPDISRGSMEDS